MNNTKLRFGAILLVLSLVLVACGGSAEETVEEPAVEEAPAETLAAPATTSPPPEKLLIWAEEKIAVALDPLVGAYESAAGVDVEVVIYDFGSIKDDVLTAELIQGVSHGTLLFNDDGTFTYTHDGGEDESDFFTYVAFDGDFYSLDTAVVTICIDQVNDCPEANDDYFSIDEVCSMDLSS